LIDSDFVKLSAAKNESDEMQGKLSDYEGRNNTLESDDVQLQWRLEDSQRKLTETETQHKWSIA
jgi:hypothetical protein